MERKPVFETLNGINVNGHTEEKVSGGTKLTYLSWAWAWAEVKKEYPDANYEIVKFNGLPYVFDPLTGYMVYTTVTIDGVTHEMWLPVMDGANKAMKDHPYEYQTKSGKKTVEAATMFDINKTIMRCLTKNLAMHGLGLYIYAGEDLPEGEEAPAEQPKQTGEKKLSASQLKAIQAAANKIGLDGDGLHAAIKNTGKTSLKDLSVGEASKLIEWLNSKAQKAGA